MSEQIERHKAILIGGDIPFIAVDAVDHDTVLAARDTRIKQLEGLLREAVNDAGVEVLGSDLVERIAAALAGQPQQGEPVAWVHPIYLKSGALGFEASVCRLSPQQVPLYRHPPAPAISEGYVLVPIEPTPKMIAALGFGGDEVAAIGHGSIFAELESSYRAMLAAAPQPTEGSTDE